MLTWEASPSTLEFNHHSIIHGLANGQIHVSFSPCSLYVSLRGAEFSSVLVTVYTMTAMSIIKASQTYHQMSFSCFRLFIMPGMF